MPIKWKIGACNEEYIAQDVRLCIVNVIKSLLTNPAHMLPLFLKTAVFRYGFCPLYILNFHFDGIW